MSHALQPRLGPYTSYYLTANSVHGIYAIYVKGRIPEDVEVELESRGIKYRPRDHSDQD